MDDRLKHHVILDTSSILNRASSILNYPKTNVIIPITVVGELNKKKELQNEVGRNAKEYFKIYKQLRKQTQSFHVPVPLRNGGTFRIELNHTKHEEIQRLFPEKENDDKILAVAVNLALESKDAEERFTLVTNDGGLIAKADAIKSLLQIDNFEAILDEQDRLVKEFDDIHTGYAERFFDIEVVKELTSKKKMDYEQFEKKILKMENEDKKEMDVQPILTGDFVICKSILNPHNPVVVRVVIENGFKIVRRILENDRMVDTKGITHRNLEQQMLLDLLKDSNTSCVTVVGKAGTGKTLLTLAAALAQIEEQFLYRKLLVARPVIPMGKDIGYLPGDKDEKLKMWMQPIFDNLEYIYNKEFEKIETKKKGVAESLKVEKKRKDWQTILAESPHIEMEALSYIRGRSIPNQFIIIDEAQNLTAHEIKTIVTRAGKGTKIVFCGDPEQIDNPYLDSVSNGLTYLTEKMKGQKMFGTVKLEKTERSELAEIASILL